MFSIIWSRKKLLTVVCLFLLILLPGRVDADVVIKIVVVNPSDTEAGDVPVKYELPPEISEEDIKDSSGLKLEYDVEKGAYTIKDKVFLEAGEKKVLKVLVNDIWRTPESQIDELRDLLRQSLDAVDRESPEKKASVQKVADKINEKIENMINGQREVEEEIDKRIQRFKSDAELIKKLRDEIFSIEMFARMEQKEDEAEKVRGIKLVVEAENPTAQKITLPFKYYLPADVKPEHILDFKGFDYRYDTDKRMSYLIKTEEFEPNQKKKWLLEIKNVWNVPEKEVRGIVDEAERAARSYAKTRFKELSDSLLGEIRGEAAKIISSQSEVDNVTDIIYTYKMNKHRFDLIKDDLLKLQSMAIQDAEKKHNVLRDIELPKDLHQISDVLLKKIFKEGKISLYKMILGTIVFLAIVTFVACAMWLKDFNSDSNKQFQSVRSEDKIKS